MGFWLDQGVAGFRIDMAFSLIKDDVDPERAQALTAALWRGVREWLDEHHPDAVIIPEGKEPRAGDRLAFHADFFLVIHEEHASLFDNHAAGVLPWQPPREPFFDAAGLGSTEVFLASWNSVRGARPLAAGHHVDRRPRLLAAACGIAYAGAAGRGTDLPPHLGHGPVPLLR